MIALPPGRGAWPNTGAGGTLLLDGTVPFPGGSRATFYRAPANRTVPMPGSAARQAQRLGEPVLLNDYAVHLAVKALQVRCGLIADGLFGPNTAAAAATYQHRAGLVADGIVGPTTARHMFKPLIAAAAGRVVSAHGRLAYLTGGHLAWESRFDPGAVGEDTTDVGIAQINDTHKMTLEQRLDPVLAIGFAVKLVEGNLDAFPASERDGIAAYNLGVAGARKWVLAGRPRLWGKTDVPKYIDSVLNSAATV